MSQSFENHAHRPVPTVVGYFFVVIALVAFLTRWLGMGGRFGLEVGLLAVVGAIITLLFITRRYITRLQDRIIKLEMRVRTAQLLTADQQRDLFQLTNKHVAALRFASDAELAALASRAARERLSPRDIKRSVKNWVPDLDRT